MSTGGNIIELIRTNKVTGEQQVIKCVPLVDNSYDVGAIRFTHELTTVTLARKGKIRTFTKHSYDKSKMCKSSFNNKPCVMSLNLLNSIILSGLPRKKKKAMKIKLGLGNK